MENLHQGKSPEKVKKASGVGNEAQLITEVTILRSNYAKSRNSNKSYYDDETFPDNYIFFSQANAKSGAVWFQKMF